MLDKYLMINPKYGAARADLFRYLCVYAAGGVYLDIKAKASLPLSSVIRDDDEYILSQWGSEHLKWGRQAELKGISAGEFTQWHIIACPRHPFLKAVIDAVVQNISDYNPFLHTSVYEGVWRTTGPIAYTKAIHPMLAMHAHRFADSKKDLGFSYSIFENDTAHTHHYSSYTRQTEPLIQRGLLICRAYQCFLFIIKCFSRLRRDMRRLGHVAGLSCKLLTNLKKD
jgi:mannosyltransferase OCH1-like enzyme